MLAVIRNEALPFAYLLLPFLLLVALHGLAALSRPAARRGRLLRVTFLLLGHAVLAAKLEPANHVLEGPIERSRVEHVLAAVWAGIASLLGLGKTIEAVGVPIRTGRRGLIVNAQAKGARQILVHRLGKEQRGFEAHGICCICLLFCILANYE